MCNPDLLDAHRARHQKPVPHIHHSTAIAYDDWTLTARATKNPSPTPTTQPQGYPAYVATLASLHACTGNAKATLAAFDAALGANSSGAAMPGGVEARIKLLQVR